MSLSDFVLVCVYNTSKERLSGLERVPQEATLNTLSLKIGSSNVPLPPPSPRSAKTGVLEFLNNIWGLRTE
jgi:hypothetical protein